MIWNITSCLPSTIAGFILIPSGPGTLEWTFLQRYNQSTYVILELGIVLSL